MAEMASNSKISLKTAVIVPLVVIFALNQCGDFGTKAQLRRGGA